MVEIKKKQICCGCSACYDSCPVNCINMEYDEEGFRYPKIDKTKCINCKKCESVCPILQKDNQLTNKNVNISKTFAVQNKNLDERMNSSSGGIFALLAKQIIKDNGLVVGAVITKDLTVKHIIVDNEEELKKIYGSKYLQSELDGVYKNIKRKLSENKLVLFSGTPCQIVALKSFLKNDYDNLILVDIVCHGVPSKKVWDSYIKWISNRKGKKVKNIYFRDKKNGWKNYNIVLEYDDYEREYISHSEDLFFNVYLDNIDLRPSCYECNFKNYNRDSDITLGDLWGIKEICPELDDDKGTSLMLINTEKGLNLWKKINVDKYNIIEIDRNVAFKHNSAAIKSVKKHLNHNKFYRNLKKMPFDKAAYDAMKLNILQKAFLKAKRKIDRGD